MTPFSTSALPFAMPSPWGKSRQVFAHYFGVFPLSIDNKPADSDYYKTQFLTPTGENNKHLAYGGFLRSGYGDISNEFHAGTVPVTLAAHLVSSAPPRPARATTQPTLSRTVPAASS